MKTGTVRRKKIIDCLVNSKAAVTGKDLSERFGVSRQIIVQDIALLRAAGERIIATPQGYLVEQPVQTGYRTTLACRHTMDFEEIEEELRVILDLGGKIIDVIVEHPLYGELRGALQICSRRDLAQFLLQLRETRAKPLSYLTKGIHLHTIETPTPADAGEVKRVLAEKGILIEED